MIATWSVLQYLSRYIFAVKIAKSFSSVASISDSKAQVITVEFDYDKVTQQPQFYSSDRVSETLLN